MQKFGTQLIRKQYIRNWFDISKRCLGSGLYSKVYKASYKSSGNQLAVKIVDLDEIEDEKNKRMIKLHKADKERLLNEVKILASLNHVSDGCIDLLLTQLTR